MATDHFIAFWNVENLFAPEGLAGREDWLAKQLKNDLAGWTDALFKTKINQLASIIRKMNAQLGPDILGVCEVENVFVLEQLVAKLNGVLTKRKYGVVHVDSTRDHRGIDTAFIFDRSKYTVGKKQFFLIL
jgi:predicted extracellular nuclease